ncbi:adenosylcobinamide-GDP ribazoletransferase [Flectobacillus roseus]|uniref:Adenosylcobinamide-GDP ribazoletransferase n=2 Tax=Flectobacillus TaxID=101 RepID=A0ABT6YFK2_9BACT|nr:adenosylcobinamide-GDP ribazoletransferase [Flectobacillus roseus]MDI9862364.1 adenosylcobinamide-GDP ribazoletransferase [Flectobacillus roseus]
MLTRQFHIFLNALMFYTRIPVPKWMKHDEDMLNQATVYFPVIGWIVGAISSLVFYLFSLVLPFPIAILLSLVASILTTGGFHEDGLADVCDGFGGGWTKQKILDIMKDSRLGTFGLLGLGLVMVLKVSSLFYIGKDYQIYALMLVHPLSRYAALSMIFTHEYVREDALSKAKPIGKKIGIDAFFVASIFALLPMCIVVYVTQDWKIIGILVPIFLMRAYLARFFTKWLGGYTGDCLGSIQQLTEVIAYLYLVGIWTVK